MPTVTVHFVDGSTKTFHPQVTRFGGVDLQLCGDPDHMTVLDLHRSEFTTVEFVAGGVRRQTWGWDGPRPDRRLGDDERFDDVAPMTGPIQSSVTRLVTNSNAWTWTNNESLAFDLTYRVA